MTSRRPLPLLIILSVLFLTTHVAAADKFTVVIDAGHGGKDPGAVNGKSQEKSINLNVALKLGSLIEKNCPDVKVIYTRKTDVFVELYKRADIANKANADFFISIHTNAAKSTSAHGAETYLLGAEENRTSANLSVAIEENRAILLENDYEAHYEGYDPNSPESQIIFEFMQNEYQKESLSMATMVQNGMVSDAGRSDHGVHQAGYLVLWKSAMPSILIELGYISNTAEKNYLVSEKGQNELSRSIYKAFDKYLKARRQQEAGANSTQASILSSSESSSNGKNDDKSSSAESPVFKVQILTSDTKLPENSSKLKNLKDVSYYKDGKLYKYTCGSTTDYEQARREMNKLRETFKDAFIVAFHGEQRIDLNKAVEEYRKHSSK